MGNRTRNRIVVLALAALSASGNAACTWRSAGATLPTRLPDEEFWGLSQSLSEPAGVFKHSENLVSNERLFVHLVRLLQPRGGVYIGVGPEQNFSYIARIEPAMAFIVDIRQENRNLHLMYKALFEASADRAEFVSRLFARERPGGLDADTSVQDLFAAYTSASASSRIYESNRRLVRERLLDVHRLPLSENDLASIDTVLNAFYSDGPEIHYGRSRPEDEPGPSYRVLMTATDLMGRSRSYLAGEDAFQYVKDLHSRNLIVPVVGDFGGAVAIGRVSDYVQRQGSVVSAFYASNVEVYLNRQQLTAFCRDLTALPSDSRTWFIGSKGLQPLTSKLKTCPPGRP